MILRRIAILTFVAALSSCRGRPVEAPGSFSVAEIYVEARNFHPDHVTFHYYRNRSKRRLGDVLAARRAQFRLTWDGPADLSFEVDLWEGVRCRTSSYRVFPGESVTVRLRYTKRGRPPECDFRVESPRR